MTMTTVVLIRVKEHSSVSRLHNVPTFSCYSQYPLSEFYTEYQTSKVYALEKRGLFDKLKLAHEGTVCLSSEERVNPAPEVQTVSCVFATE